MQQGCAHLPCQLIVVGEVAHSLPMLQTGASFNAENLLHSPHAGPIDVPVVCIIIVLQAIQMQSAAPHAHLPHMMKADRLWASRIGISPR